MSTFHNPEPADATKRSHMVLMVPNQPLQLGIGKPGSNMSMLSELAKMKRKATKDNNYLKAKYRQLIPMIINMSISLIRLTLAGLVIEK